MRFCMCVCFFFRSPWLNLKTGEELKQLQKSKNGNNGSLEMENYLNKIFEREVMKRKC